MIECQYCTPMFVTNRGLQTWFCGKFMKSVNEDICSHCDFKEGKTKKELIIKDYPKRNNKEIQAIYRVCKKCSLLLDSKICKAMHPEMHPADIIAQHPSNHCPENKW